MVSIRQKSVVDMKLTSQAQTHTRSQVCARDLVSIIDEPQMRGGTNLGFTPTETLMASLIGCTHVVTQRIAENMGVEIASMNVDSTAKFDRRGAALEEEIEYPFSDIVLEIQITTRASHQEIEKIKSDLEKYCPIAKLFRNGGVSVIENWHVKRP